LGALGDRLSRLVEEPALDGSSHMIDKCLIKCLTDDCLDILAFRDNLYIVKTSTMRVYNGFKEILNIQKFRRIVSYTGFYCFAAVVSYAYTSNT